MYWQEVGSPSDLDDYVKFEQLVFPTEDWTTFSGYEKLIEMRGLRIFLLMIDYGKSWARVPTIVGSFNVFIDNEVAFMGGFALGKAQRGFRLSRQLTNKLIQEFGHYPIICKSKPKDPVMKKVLNRVGFTNKLDRFENGKIWSYWSRLPS